MTTQTYSMSVGGAVRRIRSPHPNDVLSGRGGGINAHEGNKRFRELVALRKEDYNLAPNKAEKNRIATEVMDEVLQLDPPGRFLQRDSSVPSGPAWWIEVDEAKALAKTSQALREGAPQIRMAHQDELQYRAEASKDAAKRKRRQSIARKPGDTNTTRPRKVFKKDSVRAFPGDSETPVAYAPVVRAERPIPKKLTTDVYNRTLEKLQENVREAQATAYDEEQQELRQQVEQYSDGGAGIIAPLTSNKNFAERYGSPAKGYRFDTAPISAQTSIGVEVPLLNVGYAIIDGTAETPPLVPAPAPAVIIAPLNLGGSSNGSKRYGSSALRNGKGLTRVHSLALSDFSTADLNSAQDEFVNPFADESDVGNGVSIDDSEVEQSSVPLATTGATLRNLSSADSSGFNGNSVDTQIPYSRPNWGYSTASR
jgi:hypothetical protein